MCLFLEQQDHLDDEYGIYNEKGILLYTVCVSSSCILYVQ